jgi:hypothetical protein
MNDKESDGTALWHSTSARNLVLFAIAFLAPLVPIVLFLRRLHVTTAIICFLIAPSVLFGLVMVVRPTWVERMRRVVDRELQRVGEGLERRPPTGLP